MSSAEPCLEARQAAQWRLARNCCLRPDQFLRLYMAVLGFNALIAAGFWVMGFPLVAPFALLEALGLTAALVHHARHACDHEVVTLQDGQLVVERHSGGQVARTALQAAWVNVRAEPDALVSLSERGVKVRVGEYVRPEVRLRMMQELRAALSRG